MTNSFKKYTSSETGSPPKWKTLEEEAKKIGIEFVGVPSTTFSHTISLENSAKLFTGRPALLSVKYKLARIEPVG